MIKNQEIRTVGYAAEIDVAVLLIFFVRDEVLELTFEQVRKARPSTLFLWQDGPRDGRSDDLQIRSNRGRTCSKGLCGQGCQTIQAHKCRQ